MRDQSNVMELEDMIFTLEFWLRSKGSMNEVEPRRLGKALDALSEVYAMHIRDEVHRRTKRTDGPFDLDQDSHGRWYVIKWLDTAGSTTVGTFPSVLQAGRIILEMLDEARGE